MSQQLENKEIIETTLAHLHRCAENLPEYFKNLIPMIRVDKKSEDGECYYIIFRNKAENGHEIHSFFGGSEDFSYDGVITCEYRVYFIQESVDALAYLIGKKYLPHILDGLELPNLCNVVFLFNHEDHISGKLELVKKKNPSN